MEKRREREREHRGAMAAAGELGVRYEGLPCQNPGITYHAAAPFRPTGAARQPGIPAYQPPPGYPSASGARGRPRTVDAAAGSAGAASLIHGDKEPWEK